MDADVIARGHNLAILIPPVPAAAEPHLRAIAVPRHTLVLTADADRAVALHGALPPGSAVAVSGLARAARQLAGGLPRFLLVSANDALGLLKRSALKAAECETVVLAWPEQLDEEGREALETVMGEVARDSQRLLLVGVADAAVQELIERYAFKAVTSGFPPVEPDPAAPVAPSLGPASFVVARPEQLEAVRRRILDALDPASDDAVAIALCPPGRAEAEALATAAAAAASGDVRDGRSPGVAHHLVLVVEPCQLPWLRTLFTPLTPLRLPTALDALEQRADALRARLTRTIEKENLDRELFLLGPLLSRFDPTEVAAAALRLATSPPPTAGGTLAAGSRMAEQASAGSMGAIGDDSAQAPAWTRLWVGVGRKDNARPGDVLGAIVGEAKIGADHVGKIEVRELYALVDVRAEDAERVVRSLTGTTLRGRRLTARVDRGGGRAQTGARRV